MIPKNSGILQQDFTIEEQPTFTYALDNDKYRVRGNIDGLKAVEQAVYKMISTERYQYVIYSRNYGVQLLDLFGKPTSYVIPEVKRRITEALLWDKRITKVDDFDFKIAEKGILNVSFRVITIFGNFIASRAVNF